MAQQSTQHTTRRNTIMVTATATESQFEIYPDGPDYHMVFTHIEDAKKPAQYVEEGQSDLQWKWKFDILGPEQYAGKILSLWTNPTLGKGSTARLWCETMLGRPLVTGEELEIDSLYGTHIGSKLNDVSQRTGNPRNSIRKMWRWTNGNAPGSPQEALQRLQAAIDATHMQRGEVLAVWTELGYKGRTRDSLSPVELEKAIARYEEIAQPLADTDPADLAF